MTKEQTAVETVNYLLSLPIQDTITYMRQAPEQDKLEVVKVLINKLKTREEQKCI